MCNIINNVCNIMWNINIINVYVILIIMKIIIILIIILMCNNNV